MSSKKSTVADTTPSSSPSIEQNNPWADSDLEPRRDPKPSSSSTPISPIPTQDPSLPRYSDASPALPPRRENIFPYNYRALTKINYSKYRLPESTIEDADKQLIITRQPQLGTSPQALAKLLREQAALPPKPTIRIIGSHKFGTTVYTDFDLRINLQSLILHPDGQKWNYIKVAPPPSGKRSDVGAEDDGRSLEEWVRRFCADRAELKQITLERKIVNFDADYLEGQVRTLVAATKYQGKLLVSFAMPYSKVAVRLGKEPIFNWKKFFMGSQGSDKSDSAVRYDVIESIWPFANAPPEAMEGRECVVQSEQSFWNTWKVPIRNAILSGLKGYVTAENWMDAAMGEILPPPASPWPSRPFMTEP